jgi:hypothetical protein
VRRELVVVEVEVVAAKKQPMETERTIDKVKAGPNLLISSMSRTKARGDALRQTDGQHELTPRVN